MRTMSQAGGGGRGNGKGSVRLRGCDCTGCVAANCGKCEFCIDRALGSAAKLRQRCKFRVCRKKYIVREETIVELPPHLAAAQPERPPPQVLGKRGPVLPVITDRAERHARRLERMGKVPNAKLHRHHMRFPVDPDPVPKGQSAGGNSTHELRPRVRRS